MLNHTKDTLHASLKRLNKVPNEGGELEMDPEKIVIFMCLCSLLIGHKRHPFHHCPWYQDLVGRCLQFYHSCEMGPFR
jgi:hypothetical protein